MSAAVPVGAATTVRPVCGENREEYGVWTGDGLPGGQYRKREQLAAAMTSQDRGWGDQPRQLPKRRVADAARGHCSGDARCFICPIARSAEVGGLSCRCNGRVESVDTGKLGWPTDRGAMTST